MKKEHKEYLIVAAVVIAILWIFLGRPTSVGVAGVNFDIPPAPDSNKPLPEPTIFIKNLTIRQAIYAPGENATVDFVVHNTLNVTYNWTLNWFLNGTKRNLGWTNVSSNFPQANGSYYAWFVVREPGDWQAQVIVDYSQGSQPMRIDKIVEFRVV